MCITVAELAAFGENVCDSRLRRVLKVFGMGNVSRGTRGLDDDDGYPRGWGRGAGAR